MCSVLRAIFWAHKHGRRMSNQRTKRRIHHSCDRSVRCSFHRSLRHSCLLPLAAGPSRPPPRPRRPDLEARRPRPREPGRQRAAGGPAETIWRCGSARGSAGQGAQRGRPTARRTWGKTVRDKRRLSQVPAAQASAADECRCGGLGGGPPDHPASFAPSTGGCALGRWAWGHRRVGCMVSMDCADMVPVGDGARCRRAHSVPRQGCDEAERAILGRGVRGRRRTR